ncbi:protein of unknown function [Algoriphagus faecimaris]|uniref:DUF4249 domain-containing protein n=1 Tax=Algoriphagus faecimaris TaxID=686796 RepID=A0A1G6S379_9BACT|nr:DUF4249 family protein [Algoriphagus faecimaris]SDD11360.1 protein of unknown function [Algoriphagus faecimaris]
MKRLLIIMFALWMISCQEEVSLPLASIDGEVPVIEGIWTDNEQYNEVKISLARNYFDPQSYQIISNASVSILIPGTEVVIPFRFYPESNSYKPIDRKRTARVGERYELLVEWEGQVYKASGLMLEPPILDSLSVSFQEERLFREEGYYIKAYGKIPFPEDNFYRIRVIENDTLKNNREDYLLFDDTFGLTFFEEGLELGYAFNEGDRVRLELFRMNEDVYDYFSQLVGLLFSDGGLFSPPPQNPDGNIQTLRGEGKALGYFKVTPVISSTIFIAGE